MIMTKMIRATANVAKRFMQTFPSRVDLVHDKAMANEMCILVDENDVTTGYASKRDCHLILTNNLLLHRAFSVFLFNSKNELLLQKRASSKFTFPSLFSNTCCSHPLHNIKEERETKDAIGVKLAAQRRLNFELGIPLEEADTDSMHYVTRLHYKYFGDGVWGEHEIDYILIMQKDVTLNPNPDEVSDLIYVSPGQLKNHLVDLKSPITPWFKGMMESGLLTNWCANLHQLEKITELNKIHRFSII